MEDWLSSKAKSVEKNMVFIFTYTNFDIHYVAKKVYTLYAQFIKNKAITYLSTTQLKN